MNKALAITCIILGVVLLLGVAFGVYVLLESTNYFKDRATDFWITVDGERYYSDGAELEFSDTTVEVRYLVDWLSGKRGYSYKILPVGNDFEYTVDGSVYKFLDIDDLTPAFDVSEQDRRLTVKCKGVTVCDVLQKIYPERSVTVPTSEDEYFHFKLVVTSVDGKTVSLTFRNVQVVKDIELEPPGIVF